MQGLPGSWPSFVRKRLDGDLSTRRFIDPFSQAQRNSSFPIQYQGQMGIRTINSARELSLCRLFLYEFGEQGPAIHPLAVIQPGATIARSVIGPGTTVAAGAVIRDSVIWPNQRVAADAVLDGCIVCSGRTASGVHRDADL